MLGRDACGVRTHTARMVERKISVPRIARREPTEMTHEPLRRRRDHELELDASIDWSQWRV